MLDNNHKDRERVDYCRLGYRLTWIKYCHVVILLLLARLIGKYCFVHCRLLSFGVVCRRL